jgi:hypothetical protein
VKKIDLLIPLLMLFSLACSLAGTLTPTLAPQGSPTAVIVTEARPTNTTEAISSPAATALPAAPGKSASPCGDGVCEGPENARNCPADCGALPAETRPPSQAADTPAVLNFGIMVHLEGWNDENNKASFEQHAQLIRDYAAIFESYGAKLTWESKEATDGALRWGDNVLLEMQQRGHGVGVHADIGGQKNYDCGNFSTDLAAEKKQLESLGVNVRHVSGIVSHCDWVKAASDAGFLFSTGNVAYGVMSMPVKNRPAQYRNCQTPSACHDVFPAELESRIHPWRMNSGADWLTDDPEGKLVNIPSSGGLCILDKAGDQACDEFFSELDKAIALAQPGQVNTYYVSWSLGKPADEAKLKAWLQRIDSFVKSGKLAWKTLPEMYAAYTAMN